MGSAKSAVRVPPFTNSEPCVVPLRIELADNDARLTLTTQQTADLLGVSRPTVVRLINDKVLPAERIGNRHRLLLDDVLSYREERRKRQYDALTATADIDRDDDPEAIRKRLREARRAVAARRNKPAQPS
jgi:excisionase family DNA binding protein